MRSLGVHITNMHLATCLRRSLPGYVLIAADKNQKPRPRYNAATEPLSVADLLQLRRIFAKPLVAAFEWTKQISKISWRIYAPHSLKRVPRERSTSACGCWSPLAPIDTEFVQPAMTRRHLFTKQVASRAAWRSTRPTIGRRTSLTCMQHDFCLRGVREGFGALSVLIPHDSKHWQRYV